LAPGCSLDQPGARNQKFVPMKSDLVFSVCALKAEAPKSEIMSR